MRGNGFYRFFGSFQNLTFPTWCLYYTKLEPIFKINKADELLRIIFSGEKDSQKFVWCFYEIRTRPRGGGVWGGIRAGFGFLFFGGAGI